MKKSVVIVGLILIMSAVFISGCLDKTNDGTENQVDSSIFLGAWQNIDAYPDDQTWTFYINGTIKEITTEEFEGKNITSVYWYNYEVSEDELCIKLIDTLPSQPDCFEYVFSDNNTRFILIFREFTIKTFTKISFIL